MVQWQLGKRCKSPIVCVTIWRRSGTFHRHTRAGSLPVDLCAGLHFSVRAIHRLAQFEPPDGGLMRPSRSGSGSMRAGRGADSDARQLIEHAHKFTPFGITLMTIIRRTCQTEDLSDFRLLP